MAIQCRRKNIHAYTDLDDEKANTSVVVIPDLLFILVHNTA